MTFVFPTDPQEKKTFEDLIARVGASPIGARLLAELDHGHHRLGRPAIRLGFDHQSENGYGACYRRRDLLAITLKPDMGDDDLMTTVFAHELRHAQQPVVQINPMIPYMQTFMVFYSRMLEADAFAHQIVYALDTGDSGIMDATNALIAIKGSPALMGEYHAILDAWDPAQAPETLRALFEFVHAHLLTSYDEKTMEASNAYLRKMGAPMEIPPDDAAGRRGIFNACFSFYIDLQSLPDLTSNRRCCNYLGDDHPAIVNRFLDYAVGVQRNHLSIEKRQAQLQQQIEENEKLMRVMREHMGGLQAPLDPGKTARDLVAAAEKMAESLNKQAKLPVFKPPGT